MRTILQQISDPATTPDPVDQSCGGVLTGKSKLTWQWNSLVRITAHLRHTPLSVANAHNEWLSLDK